MLTTRTGTSGARNKTIVKVWCSGILLWPRRMFGVAAGWYIGLTYWVEIYQVDRPWHIFPSEGRLIAVLPPSFWGEL